MWTVRSFLIFCILMLRVTSAYARGPYTTESLTWHVSDAFIDKFNSKYNVKGREIIIKAFKHSTGLSNMNLEADWCRDVEIRCPSHNSHMVGILFYDKLENLADYRTKNKKKSKKHMVYKVKAPWKELVPPEPIIAIFYTGYREEVKAVLKDKELSKLFLPIDLSSTPAKKSENAQSVHEGPHVAGQFSLEVVTAPFPNTKISAEKAKQIALSWYKQRWPGRELPKRREASLCHDKARFVWLVDCTVGHPEIAAWTVTVYIDAAGGNVLGVHTPVGKVR